MTPDRRYIVERIPKTLTYRVLDTRTATVVAWPDGGERVTVMTVFAYRDVAQRIADHCNRADVRRPDAPAPSQADIERAERTLSRAAAELRAAIGPKRRHYPGPVLLPSERRQWADRVQDDLGLAFGAGEHQRLAQFLKRFEAEIKYRLVKT